MPYLMEKSCIPGSFLVDLKCFPSPNSVASTSPSSIFAVLSKGPDARRPCTAGELCLYYQWFAVALLCRQLRRQGGTYHDSISHSRVCVAKVVRIAGIRSSGDVVIGTM